MFNNNERQKIEYRKNKVHPGDKIECLLMVDDPRPVLPGTKGIVEFVDDAGQIHCQWETGSTLALALEDEYRIL